MITCLITFLTISPAQAETQSKRYEMILEDSNSFKARKKSSSYSIGHTVIIIVYNLLKKRETYQEVVADYIDKQRKETIVRSAAKRLKTLGYEVDLQKLVPNF